MILVLQGPSNTCNSISVEGANSGKVCDIDCVLFAIAIKLRGNFFEGVRSYINIFVRIKHSEFFVVDGDQSYIN